MRNYLRPFAVATAALTLAFYCSCERHHPDELPAEHAATGEHAENNPTHAQAPHGEPPAAPATAAVPIPTNASPTPAEFFATPTPH